MHRGTNATQRHYRSFPARLAGVLAITALLLPAPLSGQERDVRARPVRQAVDLRTIDARTEALLGTREAERRISSRLTHRDRLLAQRIGERLRQGASFDEVRRDWEGLVSRTEPEDVDGLVHLVMREGYLDEVRAHRQAAERAQRTNERERALHEERSRLRERLREIDAELAEMNDDAELANIDVQNALQKQQQTLQTMSNVSKQMHDTAKAILRNMR